MHENVMDEMRQIQPEDETKKKMLDILKRFHSEEETECEEEDGMIRFFYGFKLLCLIFCLFLNSSLFLHIA